MNININISSSRRKINLKNTENQAMEYDYRENKDNNNNIFDLNFGKESNSLSKLNISKEKIFENLKNLSSRNFNTKINLISRFTLLPYKKNKIILWKFKFYKKIEEKFIKIFSMENLFKISRNLKIIRKFFFKEYERKILNYTTMIRNKNFKSKNLLDMSENLLENFENNKNYNTDKIIKLLEMEFNNNQNFNEDND